MCSELCLNLRIEIDSVVVADRGRKGGHYKEAGWFQGLMQEVGRLLQSQPQAWLGEVPAAGPQLIQQARLHFNI